jgi:hypothetical protein
MDMHPGITKKRLYAEERRKDGGSLRKAEPVLAGCNSIGYAPIA